MSVPLDMIRSGSAIIPMQTQQNQEKAIPLMGKDARYQHKNIIINRSEVENITQTTEANAYDKEISKIKKIPTAREFANNKIFYTDQENQKIYKDPIFKQARRLASVHEILFFLNAFLPGFRYPFALSQWQK